MSYPMHIVAVMGIVRNVAGQILLVCSPKRGWEPPGGQVENGEDVLTALKREVLEESGIRVTVGELLAVYSNVAAEPDTKLMMTFAATAVSGSLQTSPESSAVGWFTPTEAMEKVTHPAQRLKLADALEAERVVYRVYRTRPFTLLHTTMI